MVAPESHNTFFMVFLGSPWGWLALWLIAINLFTFVAYGVDKYKAKRQERKPETRRIPERNLLLSAAVGGSLGAFFGMRVWHHKTKHKIFQIGIPLMLVLHIVLIFGLFVYFRFIR